MGVTALVSVDEYLRTSFPDGDKEYVDGKIVERNSGEVDHADLQSKILVYLTVHYPDFWSAVAVRVQVKSALSGSPTFASSKAVCPTPA